MSKEIELINKAMHCSIVNKDHETAILYLKEAIELNRLNSDTFVKLAIETTWVYQGVSYLPDLSVLYYYYASLTNPENLELKNEYKKHQARCQERYKNFGSLNNQHAYDAKRRIQAIKDGSSSGNISVLIEHIYDECYQAAYGKFMCQDYSGIKFCFNLPNEFNFSKKDFPQYLIPRSCFEGLAILAESGEINKAKVHFDKAINLIKFDSANRLIEPQNWPTLDPRKTEILICLYYIFVKRAAIHEQEGEYEAAIKKCEYALACINHPLLGKKCELFYDPEPHIIRHRCEAILIKAAREKLENETRLTNQAHQSYYYGDYESCTSSCEYLDSQINGWKVLYSILCDYQLGKLKKPFSKIDSLFLGDNIKSSSKSVLAAAESVQKAFQTYINKANNLRSLTEQYNSWIKKIHEHSGADAIKLAICGRNSSEETQKLDGLSLEGKLNPKKSKKLSALITSLYCQKFAISKDSIAPQNFSDKHYEILIFQIAKAIRPFLTLKGKSKKVTIINTKISEKSVLADAIISAIMTAKALIGDPIPEKTGNVLEIEILQKEEAIAESNLVNTLEQLHNSLISSAFGKTENIKSTSSPAHSGPEFYERARLKFQAGNTIEAISDYRMVITQGFRSYYIYMELAQAYKNALMDKEALESYEIAIKLKPKQLQPYLEIANIHNKQKNWVLAEEYFKAAYSLDRTCFSACQGLSSVYLELKDYDKALTYCQAAIKLKPGNPELLKQRGDIYRCQNLLNDAKADYLEAIRLSPSLRASLATFLSDIEATLATESVPSMNLKSILASTESNPIQASTNPNSSLSSSSQPSTSIFHQREMKKREVCEALIRIKQNYHEGAYDNEKIERDFKALEVLAFELEYTEFFVERGDFYFNQYRQITDQNKKNVTISNALADYSLASKFNPYYPGLSDKKKECESCLKQINPANVKGTLFQPENSSKQASAPLPSREALTAEQLAKLEEIKARIRQTASQ